MLMRELWRFLPSWTLLIETDKWLCNRCTVSMRESLRFLFFGFYFRIWMIASFFLFSFCHTWTFCFSFKYSSSFVWDSHTLLDRGNLCHSDVLCRLCCLLRFLCLLLFGIFVQHFWHLVLASQFVCHFYSHFFLVLAFAHCTFCSCYILFLACPPFLYLLCASGVKYLFLYLVKSI